jgi:outer membrane protein assembly factor BamB
MKRVLWLVPLAALALGGCNWFRNLGKKDNVEPPRELIEFAPTATVQTLWSTSVGGGAGRTGAHVAPVVVDGRVYAAGIDGTLAAFDAASGAKLWSRHDGERSGGWFRRGDNSIRWAGGPAASGDLVVVGGLDGQVRGYATDDGSERWQTSVSSEVIARPAIADGVVVVRSNDGRISALNIADGSLRWVFEQPVPPLSLRGNSAPQVLEGMVFAGADNGKLTALALADGSMAWFQTLASGEGRTEVERLADLDGDIVANGSEVFAAGYRGQLVAMDASSGRPEWQRELSSYAGVAVDAERVVCVDADGNVWAFDRASGANLWKQDHLLHRWLSPPAIQGSHVVVGDLEGFVHWLDLADGGLAARERVGKEPIVSAPVVAGDTVYVEDVEGRIAAYAVR